MDMALNCVRWSGDTLLLWGSCDDPSVDDVTEMRRLARQMLGRALHSLTFQLKLSRV
jgi:hypothetical protein